MSSRIEWVPPPCLIFKVNFDGAVFKEENKARIGVVIRDDSGQVIAFMHEKTSLLSSVDEVEALVAVTALIFTQEVGISPIIPEGDSEKIINSFRNGEVSFASYDHLIHEEAKFIAESFVVFNVSHINKQGILQLTILLDMLVIHWC